MFNNNQRKGLKAWVRFDGNNNAVAGSLIFQKNKPKVGTWKEYTDVNLCCPEYVPYTLITSVVLGIPPDLLCIGSFTIYCNNIGRISAGISTYIEDATIETIVNALNLEYSFLGNWIVVSPSEVGLQLKQSIADELCPGGELSIEIFCGG
jgi:hypothetical protein